MRIVVTGATGNVGTSLLQALSRDDRVTEIVGLARRMPSWSTPRTRFVAVDVASGDLVPHFEGADAVVHLAWLIQPSRDQAKLERVNVEGSRRVFEAAGRAGARAIVHASSVGAYSPGPKDRRVDESWPVEGIPSSYYSRQKVAAERALDAAGREFPALRVVRLRPGLVFKREAATGIRRLFIGPFLPSPLVRPDLLPVVPDTPRLAFQGVHSRDVGDAYARAALDPGASGAFNVAAEPVLDPATLARVLGARRVPVPAAVLRGAAAASWALRVTPASPDWLDLALGIPLMDVRRAREVLGWTPRHSASDALLELLGGLRDSAGLPTPPLDPATSGPLRLREVLTGIGRAEP